MPFAQAVPRPFHERGIWSFAPAAPGVFGLSNAKGWIHVAETGDIRSALLDCLNGQDTGLLAHAPTGFVFEQCSVEVRKQRRLQLTMEYRPSHTPAADSGARQ